MISFPRHSERNGSGGLSFEIRGKSATTAAHPNIHAD
jgi:hypothetical protein